MDLCPFALKSLRKLPLNNLLDRLYGPFLTFAVLEGATQVRPAPAQASAVGILPVLKLSASHFGRSCVKFTMLQDTVVLL